MITDIEYDAHSITQRQDSVNRHTDHPAAAAGKHEIT